VAFFHRTFTKKLAASLPVLSLFVASCASQAIQGPSTSISTKSTATKANTTLAAPISLISYASVGYSTGSGTLPVTTKAINTTGANFIAACHVEKGSATSVSTPPTDSMGNIWTLANTINETGRERIGLWYVLSPSTSSTHTFTFKDSNSSGTVMAYSGVSSGPDKRAATSENIPLSVSVTPANPNELILSCLGLQSAHQAAINAPLATLGSIPCNSCSLTQPLSYQTAFAYQIQGAAAPVVTTWATSDGSTPLGEMVTDTFPSIESSTPLSIAGSPVEGLMGAAYSYQLQSTGGVTPFVWGISSGSFPSGLNLSSQGLISGTPTAAVSKSPVTISISDQSGTIAYTNLSITIASTPVTIPAVTCPVGTQYQPYAGCTIAATGGTPPYTYAWSHSSSFLSPPEGLTVDLSAGTLTGTPTGEGAGYIMSWTATDSMGAVSPAQTVRIDLNGDNKLGNCSLFPSDSIFHLRIDSLPVDSSPAAAIGPTYSPTNSIRLLHAANTGGIPFFRVAWDAPLNPVIVRSYQAYFGTTSGGAWCTSTLVPLCGQPAPIPFDAPVEGTLNSTGDQHVLILQTGNSGTPCKLWEMWASHQTSSYWNPGSDAYWSDLGSYTMPPDNYGTTDAAGLPITPFLVTATEVIGTGTAEAPNGSVEHAIRLTLSDSSGTYLKAHVWPATSQVGSGVCTGSYTDPTGGKEILQTAPPVSCTSSPAFGEMFRLKADVNSPACASTSPQAAIIMDGLRKYGMIYADRGGSGYLMATPDARWNDADLACLQQLKLTDFEPVNVGIMATSTSVVQGSATYKVPSSYRAVP